MTSESSQASATGARGPIIAVGVIGLALVATVLIIRSLLTGASQHPMGEFKPVAFDAEVWRESEVEHSWESVRLRMVDDLLASRVLIGMRRIEVIELLGPPPKTGYFKNWDLVYPLGAERSYFAVDSEWLLIQLDDTGHVVEAVTATD